MEQPLPSSSAQPNSNKRKCSEEPQRSPKIRRLSESFDDQGSQERVAYWAQNSTWNTDLFPEVMSQSTKRARSDSGSSNRTSHRTEYVANLQKHGVHMNEPSQGLDDENCERYKELLTGARTEHTYYPFSNVFRRLQQNLQGRGEDRIRRDLGDWITPSPENLSLLGEQGLDHLREELNIEWTRCEPMGGTRPKPDFAVGFDLMAFTIEQTAKLQNRATLRKAFKVTPGLCFPFFVSEAKSADGGFEKAERQNVHSGAIAVRTIVELYKDAFGPNHETWGQDIYGRILCYSISHDHDQVKIHGHYALYDDAIQSEQYYRYFVDVFHLVKQEDRLKPYNFVRELYEKFGAEHLQRIRKAVAELPEVQPTMPPPPLVQSDEVSNEFRTPESMQAVLMAQQLTELREQLQSELNARQRESKDRERESKDREREAKDREEAIRREAKELTKLRELLEQQSDQFKKQLEKQQEASERSMRLLLEKLPGPKA